MQTKLAIILGCLCFLLNSYAFAAGCSSSSVCGRNYQKPSSGCASRNDSCQCADPACINGDNDCMSRAKCCAAFGNIGGFKY